MNKKEPFCNSTCRDQINMAERELSAFIHAVTELYGPEQAKLSAEDWLDESELMNSPPGAASRNWRAVTVAASARLARGIPARDHRTHAASTNPMTPVEIEMIFRRSHNILLTIFVMLASVQLLA